LQVEEPAGNSAQDVGCPACVSASTRDSILRTGSASGSAA